MAAPIAITAMARTARRVRRIIHGSFVGDAATVGGVREATVKMPERIRDARADRAYHRFQGGRA
jgi:hypothetical protein